MRAAGCSGPRQKPEHATKANDNVVSLTEYRKKLFARVKTGGKHIVKTAPMRAAA